MTASFNATHGAASAAPFFSTTPSNIMQFITHNHDASIQFQGTCLQGELTASYKELVGLFGKPFDGDGYKTDAEWTLLFEDGTAATVYNYKNGKNYCGDDGLPVQQITEWHIGGRSRQAVDHVQIALDLYRESKTPEPEDKVEAAFKTAFDMMDSIRNKHGQTYADTVEVAILVRKHGQLTNSLLNVLVDTEVLSEKSAKALFEIDSMIGSKIIGKMATAAKVEPTLAGAKSIMDWADKLMEYEQKGAEELFAREDKKGGDDK